MPQIHKILGKVVRAVLDKNLPPPTDKESVHLAEAQRSFQELHHLAETSQCRDEWSDNIKQVRRLALGGDLRHFLRWDVIRKAMFVGHDTWVVKELRHLKRQKAWNVRWHPGIKESPVGHPPPFIFCRGSSGNLVHHAYHLVRFEDLASTPLQKMDFVVEFGGGYGSMCRLFYQLGFSGTYVIFDLPEFSILQTYYLNCLGLPIQKQRGISSSGIHCISDLEELQLVVSNRVRGSTAMFAAMWSLSECPIALRAKVLGAVGNMDFWLYGYQQEFGEINNVEFFRDVRMSCPEVEWHEEKIPHLNGNYYLVGKRGAKTQP